MSQMALLKDVPTIDIFRRLVDIDYALRDYFISWEQTKRLLQEQAELKDELYRRGYEP